MSTSWENRPMPDGERRALSALTVAVWCFALAVNVDHVEKHLRTGGASEVESTWLRWAPDVLLLVGAWKLRYQPRSVIAWSMLASGLAWLIWAALSMSANTATAKIISMMSIGVALLMTLALEYKGRAEEPAPVVEPEKEPEAKSVTRPRRPRNVPPPPADLPEEPETPVETPVGDKLARRPATEADLDRLVRPLALAGRGRPAASAALKAEGLTCSNDGLAAYLKSVKETSTLDEELLSTEERTQA